MNDNYLKRVLVDIHHTCKRYQNRCSVSHQFCKLKKQIRRVDKVFFDPISNSDRILLLVPHADDELISCHTFIKENIERTTLFYCSLTGSNPSLGNKKIRRQEFLDYCQSIGADYLEVGTESDLYGDLVRAMDVLKPSIVCLPSFIDWHKEHILLSKLLNEFLRGNPNTPIDKIIVYSVSFPMHFNFVNMVYPMSRDEQKEKWALFDSIYKSQKGLPKYRFMGWENLYSHFFNLNYATEFFHCFDVEQWKKWYSNSGDVYVEPSVINKLKYTLEQSKKLYGC